MRIILLLISIFLISCWNKNTNKKNEKIVFDNKDTLILKNKNTFLGTENIFFTEKNILPYYNKEWSSYSLKDSIKAQIIPFSKEQQKIQLKGEKYFYTMSSDGYYKISEWKVKDVSFELILYTIFGENDRQNLVTQINSYNGQKPIDALILDMRLDFETRIYSNFQIKNDSIFIERYEINGILYSDNGEIIGQKKDDTLKIKELYQINNEGKFIKQ